VGVTSTNTGIDLRYVAGVATGVAGAGLIVFAVIKRRRRRQAQNRVSAVESLRSRDTSARMSQRLDSPRASEASPVAATTPMERKGSLMTPTRVPGGPTSNRDGSRLGPTTAAIPAHMREEAGLGPFGRQGSLRKAARAVSAAASALMAALSGDARALEQAAAAAAKGYEMMDVPEEEDMSTPAKTADAQGGELWATPAGAAPATPTSPCQVEGARQGSLVKAGSGFKEALGSIRRTLSRRLTGSNLRRLASVNRRRNEANDAMAARLLAHAAGDFSDMLAEVPSEPQGDSWTENDPSLSNTLKSGIKSAIGSVIVHALDDSRAAAGAAAASRGPRDTAVSRKHVFLQGQDADPALGNKRLVLVGADGGDEVLRIAGKDAGKGLADAVMEAHQGIGEGHVDGEAMEVDAVAAQAGECAALGATAVGDGAHLVDLSATMRAGGRGPSGAVAIAPGSVAAAGRAARARLLASHRAHMPIGDQDIRCAAGAEGDGVGHAGGASTGAHHARGSSDEHVAIGDSDVHVASGGEGGVVAEGAAAHAHASRSVAGSATAPFLTRGAAPTGAGIHGSNLAAMPGGASGARAQRAVGSASEFAPLGDREVAAHGTGSGHEGSMTRSAPRLLGANLALSGAGAAAGITSKDFYSPSRTTPAVLAAAGGPASAGMTAVSEAGSGSAIQGSGLGASGSKRAADELLAQRGASAVEQGAGKVVEDEGRVLMMKKHGKK